MLEKTANYILEIVAPIFNRQGYIGTSLSDLTRATQLTKGALYGNFKNKDELALLAFELNIKKVLQPLNAEVSKVENHWDKVGAVLQFYRSYYDRMKDIGGCPFMNVSIDAKYNHPTLFSRAKSMERKKQQALTTLIQEGVKREEIIPAVDAESLSKNIYSTIVGASFMTFVQDDESYLKTALDHLEFEVMPPLRA